MFDIGQKIVCVNATFPSKARLHAYMKHFPVKGAVYAVRNIIPAQGYKGEETCAVLLVGIDNPTEDPKGRGEFGFAHTRFAPMELVKKKLKKKNKAKL